MLCHLHIRNFIIAGDIELDVQQGLTVLSGETGAGKSIILDALFLLAGGRADSSQVRHGEEKAELSATFLVTEHSPSGRWLHDQELWQDGECIVRRVITADGRSRAFINATAVPVTKLKEFGDLVLHIHAQHEHQRLMRSEEHIGILDRFAQTHAEVKNVRQLYREWKTIERRVQELQASADKDNAEHQLMTYQLEELRALGLSDDELEELEQEHQALSHAEEMLLSASQVSARLNSEDSDADVLSELRQAIHQLEPQANLHPALSGALSLLNEAHIALQEAATDLQRFASDFEWDPERFSTLDARLSSVYDIARKHQCRAEALPALQRELEAKAEHFAAHSEELDALLEQLTVAQDHYETAAQALSTLRQARAPELAEALALQLHKLNMPHATLICHVAAHPERPSANGIDDVELRLSANPGQPVQPLHKAASGGELSRIALAIQVLAQHTQQAATLFFDEVDVGISGATAEEVGRLIRQLSQHSQILCITHLPQVASFGHHHWLIEKHVVDGQTLSQVVDLDAEARTQEVARLISGVRVTDATLMHARDLLAAPLMH